MVENKKLKLDASVDNSPPNPIMVLVGHGSHAYVWIGTDDPGGQCFAHISLTRLKNFLKK